MALVAPFPVIDFVDVIEARPAWQAQAACKGAGLEVNFFPERGQRSAVARFFCSGCDVREECLDYALGFGDGTAPLPGIWGGKSDRERQKLRGLRKSG